MKISSLRNFYQSIHGNPFANLSTVESEATDRFPFHWQADPEPVQVVKHAGPRHGLKAESQLGIFHQATTLQHRKHLQLR